MWKERAAVMKHIVVVKRCTIFHLLPEDICLYIGSVLANVGSCIRSTAGRKGSKITKEESA